MEVYFTSPFVPRELIAAYGLRPRGVESFRPAPTVAGGCPFAEAFLHTVRERKAAAVFTTACDQMRRAADEAENAFLLNVPATWQTPAAREFYHAELRRLGRFLERIGGQRPAPDQLAAEIHRTSPVRDRGRGGDVIPLALVGESPLLCHAELLKHIAWDTTSDRTPLFDPAQLAKDPFAAIADAYFDGIADIFQRPDARFYDGLRPRLKERGIRGIVLWHYAWCDLWRASAERLRDEFKLPVLHLDAGDATAFTGGLRTRLEAFLEMLRA